MKAEFSLQRNKTNLGIDKTKLTNEDQAVNVVFLAGKVITGKFESGSCSTDRLFRFWHVGKMDHWLWSDAFQSKSKNFDALLTL